MPIPHRKHIKEHLIEVLSSKGAMSTTDIYAFFANLWSLSSAEMVEERSGGPLYKNEIRWARQELAQEGMIEKPSISGRGIWQLTGETFSPPEEYDEDIHTPLTEGALKKISVNAYERSQKAREICLKTHGYSCAVCEVELQCIYGVIGKNCIHIHHLVEISSIGKEYVIDPIKDMVPVCPNCHYIIHRRKPAFTIDEVRAMLKTNKLSEVDV